MSSRLLSVPALLADRAGKQPESIAMQHVDGRALSMADLLARAKSRAAALRGLGVQPGDRVIVYADDYFESFVSWLGTGLAGAIEVPVNPALRSSSLAHPISDSGSSVALTTRALFGNLRGLGAKPGTIKTVVLLDEWEDQDEDEDETGWGAARIVDRDEFDSEVVDTLPFAPPEIWDTACIIYTSGTTGRPKGVLLPWGQIAHNCRTSVMKDPQFSGPRYSYAAPFHMSGKYNFTCALDAAETMVVRDGFSLSNYWADIRRYGCTYSQLFPQLAHRLLTQPELPDDADNPLQYVWCFPAFPDVDQFKKRFGVVRIATGFGMTEIGGPIVNRNAMSSNWQSSGTVVDNPSGIEAKLVDEHDMEVPSGEVGEIVVRTRDPWALNTGYYNLPDATAAAWRNGWFHTGDAMRIDADGTFHFVDRMKDCIRRNGENISSFEVEGYARQHHAVAEVAAIGIPSPLGEEEIKIVVVRAPDTAVSAEELVSYLGEIMPRFMVPRYVEFADRLPKTAATDRVRKAELKKDPLNPSTWDAKKKA